MSELKIAAPSERFASWLLEPMRRNRGTYGKVVIAAVLINVFALVTALFTMTVYDRVLPNNATASLIALSIGLAIVIVFDFVLKLLRAYFVDIAGAAIDREVGETLFRRILELRLDQKKGSTGSLAGLMRELEALRDFFASATLTAVVDLPFILLILAVIAVIGGGLVLVPAVMVPIVILVGALTQPAMSRLSAAALGEGLHKQSVLVETIGGLETVKAAGAGPLLARRWNQAIEQHSATALRQRLVASIGIITAGAAGTLSYAGVVIIGAGMIADQTLTVGGMIACSILAGRAVAPLAQISQLLSRMTQTRTAYRQLNQLMRMPPEGPEGQALRFTSPKGAIEFRNVSFRYPGATEKTLDEVSFRIAPGEHVALLGRIGSGKSTIARLLLGLYPPEEGLVMLDGTDIRQIEPADLRRHVGAVLQESVLLSGTVRENIVLDREHVDEAEFLRASELAGTHSFMGQMANGYDLRLTDRGEGLSGGQRQSIALARTLAGRPPIVVFDEPTSAMDTMTEALLVQRLQQELDGRTLLLITHRAPLLALVNRVLLVEGGRVAADGGRDEVLKRITRQKAA